MTVWKGEVLGQDDKARARKRQSAVGAALQLAQGEAAGGTLGRTFI